MNLPTQEEIQVLRKGLKKRNLPKVFDGMWCSEPGIGGIKVTQTGSDFQVEWVTFNSGVKSESKQAKWFSLCTDIELERQRLEIGLVVYEILLTQGQKVMDSIGHPIDAFNKAKPYRDAANEWKHWGTVNAGHMLNL
jgi:hypothetical protein